MFYIQYICSKSDEEMLHVWHIFPFWSAVFYPDTVTCGREWPEEFLWQLCQNLNLYRSCLASSVKGDLVPRCNEGPVGSKGGHVFKIFPDILRCPFQSFRLCGLPVVHVSADAVVHICPKRSNKWPAVTQGKSLWCELANLHVEGDYAIVVDLRGERTGTFVRAAWCSTLV